MKNTFDSYKDYKNYFSSLVQLERKEEMEKHKEEIKNFTSHYREKIGKTILNLSGINKGVGLGGSHLVKFGRAKKFNDLQISIGDLVLVSKGKINFKGPQGTVHDIGNRYITVGFNSKPPSFVYKNNIRVDLYSNDITFQRMLDAIQKLQNKDTLTKLLLGELKLNKEKKSFYLENNELNESQIKAVNASLEAEDLFLIYGPPGTGKTTTLVQSIVNHVRYRDKILATASSNIAVDNLVENLIEKDVKVVRVGNPVRMVDKIKKHSLDNIVQEEMEYKKSRKLWSKVDELDKEQERYQKPIPKYKRGLSDKKIIELANKGKYARGLSVDVIKSMANWINTQREINNLIKAAKKLENKAVKKVLDKYEVICATNSTAGSEVLDDYKFDVVCIDEATQATEPGCLIPAVKGEKLIMAGDHKQLPPTILNQDAKNNLEQTLFERLVKVYKGNHKKTLKKQYRMNQDIMAFSNKLYYKNNIVADDSVKNHTLEDLAFDNKGIDSNKIKNILNPKQPAVFVNVNNSSEYQKEKSTSLLNKKEAKVVEKLVNNLLNSGIKAKDIGVITPYNDQSMLINKVLEVKDLEVKTVDGFQGREKEVIIISFVRSNDKGRLGFLKDKRRLNVSLTRAKRKLVLVGNASTLSSNKHYKKLINFYKNNFMDY